MRDVLLFVLVVEIVAIGLLGVFVGAMHAWAWARDRWT